MSKKQKAVAVKTNSPRLVIAVFAVFAVVAIAWLWNAGRGPAASSSAAAGSPSVPSATSAQAGSASFAGTYFPSQGHAHINPDTPDDFVYNSNPPTSGPHKEIFSDQFVNPTALPNFVQVHLLEHGNVLLQYSCSCPDVAANLSSIAYEYDSKVIATNELQPTPQEVQNAEEQGKAVIVAPYPKMKLRIALTAWTRLATLKSVDKAKIESFVSQYLTNEGNASQ